jgi:hypothetical protein
MGKQASARSLAGLPVLVRCERLSIVDPEASLRANPEPLLGVPLNVALHQSGSHAATTAPDWVVLSHRSAGTFAPAERRRGLLLQSARGRVPARTPADVTTTAPTLISRPTTNIPELEPSTLRLRGWFGVAALCGCSPFLARFRRSSPAAPSGDLRLIVGGVLPIGCPFLAEELSPLHLIAEAIPDYLRKATVGLLGAGARSEVGVNLLDDD